MIFIGSYTMMIITIIITLVTSAMMIVTGNKGSIGPRNIALPTEIVLKLSFVVVLVESSVVVVVLGFGEVGRVTRIVAIANKLNVLEEEFAIVGSPTLKSFVVISSNTFTTMASCLANIGFRSKLVIPRFATIAPTASQKPAAKSRCTKVEAIAALAKLAIP